jgi:hypothetical protein
MSKNELAIEAGYTRYRVNDVEYPTYDEAVNAKNDKVAVEMDDEVMLDCFHQPTGEWLCFYIGWFYHAPIKDNENEQ